MKKILRYFFPFVFILVLFPNSWGESPKRKEMTIPSTEVIIGIWKHCYEPGLEGLSEIDYGYLIFLPEGDYFEMSPGDYFREEVGLITERGLYVIKENEIILTPQKRIDSNGKKGGGHIFKPSRLKFIPEAKVVFFDGRENIKTTSVISGDGEINYGYGKVF